MGWTDGTHSVTRVRPVPSPVSSHMLPQGAPTSGAALTCTLPTRMLLSSWGMRRVASAGWAGGRQQWRQQQQQRAASGGRDCGRALVLHAAKERPQLNSPSFSDKCDALPLPVFVHDSVVALLDQFLGRHRGFEGVNGLYMCWKDSEGRIGSTLYLSRRLDAVHEGQWLGVPNLHGRRQLELLELQSVRRPSSSLPGQFSHSCKNR
jgi:hypothetical protein